MAAPERTLMNAAALNMTTGGHGEPSRSGPEPGVGLRARGTRMVGPPRRHRLRAMGVTPGSVPTRDVREQY